MLKLLRWAFALAMCCVGGSAFAASMFTGPCYDQGDFMLSDPNNLSGTGYCNYHDGRGWVPAGTPPLPKQAPVDPEVQRQEALRQEKIRQRNAYLNSLDQWGAIAVDIKEGLKRGMVYNRNEANVNEPVYVMPPEESAKREAVSDCTAFGGVDCQVIATFKNTCAALIATPWSGKDGAVVGLGPSLSQATEAGMALCAKITPPDVGRCVPWGKPVCTRRIDP